MGSISSIFVPSVTGLVGSPNHVTHGQQNPTAPKMLMAFFFMTGRGISIVALTFWIYYLLSLF